MRILVTGAAGQLGSDICLQLKKLKDTSNDRSFTITPFSRGDLDISNSNQVDKIFNEQNPDIVFNCAAYTNVDGCESNKIEADLINGEAPGILAAACKVHGALLVHFSTDYVFDGTKKDPYLEDDPTAPLNIYGSSKLLGEQRIKENAGKYLIIRTSWLYGIQGANFVKTILRLANDNSNLRIVGDQIGSPTFTRDLADKSIEVALAGSNGIFNVTNSGACSWSDFAMNILQLSGITDVNIETIKTVDLERPAKRPHYSVLSDQKLVSCGFSALRDWRIALKEYISESKLELK